MTIFTITPIASYDRWEVTLVGMWRTSAVAPQNVPVTPQVQVTTGHTDVFVDLFFFLSHKTQWKLQEIDITKLSITRSKIHNSKYRKQRTNKENYRVMCWWTERSCMVMKHCSLFKEHHHMIILSKAQARRWPWTDDETMGPWAWMCESPPPFARLQIFFMRSQNIT